MNQIVFDFVCDQTDSQNVEGLTNDNAWEASQFIIDNFNYQEIYNQIDNLLQEYLAKK